jgi:hypothetical protein
MLACAGSAINWFLNNRFRPVVSLSQAAEISMNALARLFDV